MTVNAKGMIWISKSLLDESTKIAATSDNSLSPTLDYFKNPESWVEFDGSCLKADTVSFSLNKVIIFTINFKIKSWQFWFDNNFTCFGLLSWLE